MLLEPAFTRNFFYFDKNLFLSWKYFYLDAI